MSRLIAFGDSFTYGQGLNGGTDGPDPKPDLRSWPYLLGNTFQVDEIHNMSIPGASNKLIWYIASNFPYEEDDIVVFAWSHVARHTIINHHHILSDEEYPEKIIDNGIHIFTSSVGPWLVGENDIATAYYNNIYQEADAWVDHLRAIDHADKIARAYTPHVYHVSIPCVVENNMIIDKDTYLTHLPTDWTDELVMEYNQKYPLHRWFDVRLLTSMDFEYAKFAKTDDFHMGKTGHAHFATRLWKLMREKMRESSRQ